MNLMNIKTLIAITLICFGLSAAAEDRIISEAYEVVPSDFRAPVTPNGGVAFKPCSACELMSVRVTPATHYAINGKAVRLDDFRKAVSQVRDRDDSIVIVLHHLESNTIKSLNVSI
jgi:hypothetical protein